MPNIENSFWFQILFNNFNSDPDVKFNPNDSESTTKNDSGSDSNLRRQYFELENNLSLNSSESCLNSSESLRKNLISNIKFKQIFDSDSWNVKRIQYQFWFRF